MPFVFRQGSEYSSEPLCLSMTHTSLIPAFLHIALSSCICYNASRQKRDMAMFHVNKERTPGCTANTFEGSSRFISVVEHPLGYLLSLLCLSNHLQMRWQVTPAATVTKKDMTISMCSPPPVAGYRLDNTVSISQNICSINNICVLLNATAFIFPVSIKVYHIQRIREITSLF